MDVFVNRMVERRIEFYGSPSRQGMAKPGALYSVDSKSSNEGSSHGRATQSAVIDNTNGKARTQPADAVRVSMSSAVSSSSQGSAQDDCDPVGELFVWGEGFGEGVLGGGVHKIGTVAGGKIDALLPRALKSTAILDIHHVACGGRHAALVTKQGEVFSWGEEGGGRLGHGVDVDVSNPQIVDALVNTNVEFVSCGEYHSCAVTLSGDLYTWGDGTHNFGLLGHGNHISHWTPKRVGGPLEGNRVAFIACGPWHTVLVTSAGQLFTFGDGTFGALGHGDKKSVSAPREVESLKGLKTVRAACGAWHTAAVVEVMVGYSSTSNCSSGKLFTWGDGDKGRLGHGDKEEKLVPTCVAALVDYNFRQVACGHSLTVALTTSGQIFTMGSSVYGQLGDPSAKGMVPGLLQGKLGKSFVEEIACGAYHIAALTSKTEVYTWGKGANGRLGHGDADDRSIPTLVEALKDKQVKNIACGASFTAAICLRKSAASSVQSTCSGCGSPFGFTKKRHNCYNCGLPYCHSCSAKKAVNAALAPNSSKRYRVCEPCFSKLSKGSEPGLRSNTPVPKKGSSGAPKVDAKEGYAKFDLKNAKSQVPILKTFAVEQPKIMEGKTSSKRPKKPDSSSRVSPAPNGLFPWGGVPAPIAFNGNVVPTSIPPSRIGSRAVSPVSRRASPPRSTTPTPTLGGLTSPRNFVDDLKRKNESLTQEVSRLRTQVEKLSQRCDLQDRELQRSAQHIQDAFSMATAETAKCKAAKEVIKSLTAQLKDLAEKLPPGAHRPVPSALYRLDIPNGRHHPVEQNIGAASEATEEQQTSVQTTLEHHQEEANINSSNTLSSGAVNISNRAASCDILARLSDVDSSKHETQKEDNHIKGSSSIPNENGLEEWVEQDQPGVYITLTALPGGGKDLKRVRFSRKRFSEKQAELWWLENRQRVYEQYNVRGHERKSPGALHTREKEEERLPPL